MLGGKLSSHACKKFVQLCSVICKIVITRSGYRFTYIVYLHKQQYDIVEQIQIRFSRLTSFINDTYKSSSKNASFFANNGKHFLSNVLIHTARHIWLMFRSIMWICNTFCNATYKAPNSLGCKIESYINQTLSNEWKNLSLNVFFIINWFSVQNFPFIPILDVSITLNHIVRLFLYNK